MENNELLEQQSGMWVTPIGDFGCQSFPILDTNKYFLTDEEHQKLDQHLLKWAYEEDTNEDILNDDKEVIDTKVIKHPKLVAHNPQPEIDRQNAINELAELHKWLADNDWKVNKIVLGEWQEDDARVVEYKTERARVRARMDEINELLKA